MTEVQRAGRAYDEQKRKNDALLLEGRVDESTQALLNVVPKEKRRVHHDFVLGNMLYGMDVKVSYDLHRSAYAREPKHPLVAFEWALQLHRAGEFLEAEKVYARIETLAYGFPGPKVRALHADCLLHLGRYSDAAASWRTANSKRNQKSIESAAHWIFGPPDPVVRRGALLAKVRNDEPEAFEELIMLDLFWRTNWWTEKTDYEYQDHDLRLAASRLGDTSRR